MPEMQRTLPAAFTPDEAGKFLDLIKRMDKGKPTPADLQALRETFDKHPDLWRISGDVINLAVQSTVSGQTKQATVMESMTRGFEDVKAQLGYGSASPIERLLIEAVALAWLRYGVIEYRYSIVTNGDQSLTQADFWERRLTLAQHRYLKAIDTLARVRRLALPVVQLNVAQAGAKQLNVAQPGQ